MKVLCHSLRSIGWGRAATKPECHFFFSLLKCCSNSDLDGKSSRQLIAWLLVVWVAFLPTERNRRTPAWCPRGGALSFSEKVAMRCRLLTRHLGPLQSLSAPAIQALLMLCTRTHTRFVQEHESKMASWNPNCLVEYSKAHGNTILLLVLQFLLLALFRAARVSYMKSHYGWILFLLNCGVNQLG